MPGAGFYAIQNSTIRFGCDGRWYADDQPITNQRIAELFSRHVHRAPNGTYLLRIADEQAPIIVDDTPYVVVATSADDTGALWIDLNDGTRERLDARTVAVGEHDVLYCRVKEGTEAARFLRPAYYQLAQHITRDGDGFIIHLGQDHYPIGRR
ncbi:MAG: hypothetical protein AB7V27_13130 [Candidatus Binatia bacterium]